MIRPGTTMTLFDGLYLLKMKLLDHDVSHNTDTGLKIFILFFKQDVLNSFEIIACVDETDFCTFFVHFQVKIYKLLIFAKIDFFHVKGRLYWYRNIFFCKIYLFSLSFFYEKRAEAG